MGGLTSLVRRDVFPWGQEEWHFELLGLADLPLYKQTNKGSGHK